MKRFAVLVAVLMIASLVLSACGTIGPTEAQVAADQCLRGNAAACEYHSALLNMEEAQVRLDAAKTAYQASLATPEPGGE